MINFYREKLNQKLYEELLPLFKISVEEVYKPKANQTLYNALELDNIVSSKVNYKYYLEKEQQGLLNICTMRNEKGELVGHFSTILNFHSQVKDLLIATTQNIHVLKEYRGKNSKDFMLFTEEILKKRGVKLLYLAVNPALKQEGLLEHMGFSIDEIVYSKGL